MNGNDKTRRLMWHGIFLFLLGLLTGLAVPALTNPRMGVSAHLEGVLNGIFLIILGLIWRELRLTPSAATATFRIAPEMNPFHGTLTSKRQSAVRSATMVRKPDGETR